MIIIGPADGIGGRPASRCAVQRPYAHKELVVLRIQPRDVDFRADGDDLVEFRIPRRPAAAILGKSKQWTIARRFRLRYLRRIHRQVGCENVSSSTMTASLSPMLTANPLAPIEGESRG